VNICKGLFAASLLLILSGQIGATLIEQDLFLVDDGLITFDSSTGLEWLDISSV
jgi:hypothetical protein